MKITVLSLFRNSEKILKRFFSNIEKLEQDTDASFEYFFYENDSTDSTVSLLNGWIENKEGKLLSETLNAEKSNSHTVSAARNFLMTGYRNKLLGASRPFSSDYTLIIDSDVDFSSNIINEYLKYMKEGVAMATPNVLQNIKCVMGNPELDSYYDSYALIDKGLRPGLIWSSNPFVGPEDRRKWDQGLPVEVYSAFGGIAIVRSDILNYVQWSTNGECEHWNFCRDVGAYGKIIVVPNIKARVEISKEIISGLSQQMNRAATIQQGLLNNHDKYFSKY